MNHNKKDILIYNFIDYVEYLIAWFDYQKNNQYGFSYRSFNLRAGIKSPNYLNRVITRQRKLSEKFIPNVVDGLGLDENEASYFRLMIQLDKCKNENEREVLIAELIKLRAKNCNGVLTRPMLHYLSRWFYPVIRELIVLKQTVKIRALAKLIKPSVSVKEINDCVKFLLRNNFIVEKNGKYQQATPILTTGDEIESEVITHYHREVLNLAAEELPDIPLEERDVSALTLALSDNSFKRIKKEIQIFRKKLLQISEEEKKPEKVYMVGFQLLSRSYSDDKGKLL